MKNIDNIIMQVQQGIKRYENLITCINPETQEGRSSIAFYKNKIANLEYRISELEQMKKDSSSILMPKYCDGKYAHHSYKEAFDILRVCYYKYFHQDPNLSPVPNWDVMFYDPTLFLPVSTYLVKGKIPFHIMFSGNYPNYKSDDSKSVSIELPFEILSKEENEEHLKCMLELIKIYSGDGVNLLFGNGISTRGTISYISEQDLYNHALKRKGDYYDFFDRLCDNNVRNIIYIGDSMKKGVSDDEITKVQTDIINLHRRLTASERMSEEVLEKSNGKIKQRVLSINNRL